MIYYKSLNGTYKVHHSKCRTRERKKGLLRHKFQQDKIMNELKMRFMMFSMFTFSFLLSIKENKFFYYKFMLDHSLEKWVMFMFCAKHKYFIIHSGKVPWSVLFICEQDNKCERLFPHISVSFDSLILIDTSISHTRLYCVCKNATDKYPCNHPYKN